MSPPQEEPVILLGAPRSGTTLLADVLGAHPQVVVLNEPRLVWRRGNDDRSDQLGPDRAGAETAAHIRHHFTRAREAAGARLVVEKTPANSLRPDFVDAVFPGARYVHITRNGWGAVPSMREFWTRRAQGFDRRQLSKLGRRLREADLAQVRHYAGELWRRARPAGRHHSLYGPRLAGLQELVDELGVLEASAAQWRACATTSACFGRRVPERYLEVKLEELAGDTLARVVEFCGLDPSPEVARAFAERFELAAARRRAPLAGDEVDRVMPYVAPTNRWLGYPPEPGDQEGP